MRKNVIIRLAGAILLLGMLTACGGSSTEPQEAIPEEDYRAACQVVGWKDLCRYPDDYKGQKVQVEVKLQQSVSDKRWRGQTDDGTGWYMDDEYYLVDKRDSDAVKLLEGDVVIVYGEFTGLETITRALTGVSSEVPRISVKYADLVEWQTCEEIYEEYAQGIRDAVPDLLAEFAKEAEANTEGIAGLAELSNDKVSALAEIESEGTQKMVATYANAGETYEDYTEWSGKLWDVYMEEAGKIQDAYMEYALG